MSDCRRIVEVEWIDSAVTGGWRSPDEMNADADLDPCRSIGYVLADDNDAIILVQSASLDESDDGRPRSVADAITIPRVVIERVRELGTTGIASLDR